MKDKKSVVFVVFIGAITIAACAPKTPEQQIVADAAGALGGRDRILAVKTITLEGEGTNASFGQDMTPDATGQQFAVSNYKRVLDVSNVRSRIEQTRTPNFAYFQGRQAQKQVLGVADGIGYNVNASGNATRTSNAVANDRKADIYHHPLTIVRAALDPGAKITNARTSGTEQAVELELQNGLKFTLAVDGVSKLPTRVVSMTDNVNLGDVAIETTFADYQEVSGLKSPTRFTVRTDKYQTATLKVSKQTIDADAGDLSTPPAAAAAPAVTGPPPANVKDESIGKGVWLLAGQSHHSVLIEFADHLTLIEAPQNEVRALAVIAKARELVPGKPLTEVVNTHHHFDHSGGVRAAIAEGLGVITQKANAAFFEDAAKRSHTIVPDAQEKAKKPAKVVAVESEMELKDASMAVNLYHIAGSPHGDAILMAYIPRDRLLIEVDVFSAGAAVQPYAANLVENITKRNLKVDRIIPLHGEKTTYAELVKAVPKS